MNRIPGTFGCAVLVALVAGCASASGGDESPSSGSSAISNSERQLDRAALLLLYGPAQQAVPVGGHEFNTKPATIRHEGGSTTISGQFSHHLSFRPDDQIFYTVVIQDTAVRSVGRRIERGGLAPIVGPLAAAIAAYYGVPIDDDIATAVFRTIGASIDGAWENTADAIIAQAAFRAAQVNL